MSPHPDRPWSTAADGGPGPALWQCLEAAAAAPSVFNSQPWRFRVRGNGVDVLTDRRRQLHVIDPRGRELLISVGAAVLNLRIAMLAHGRLPMLRLFPAPDEPDLVARVTVGGYTRITDTVRVLARAIPRRHTNRRPFAGIPVPRRVLGDLAAAARAEGGRLVVADERAREALIGITRSAETRWRAEPSYWAEVAEWTAASNDRPDGVAPEAFGPWSLAQSVPLRDFGLVQPARRREVVAFEHEPTIVVLGTTVDTRHAWVRAGQALERVLLTAAVHGVASTPMTQPLEIDDLRHLVMRVAGGMPQALLRLGYGPPCPPSRRRPLDQMLVAIPTKIPTR